MPELQNFRWERFCRAYLITFNATRAATEAGYSERSAYELGSRLLRRPQVQARLKELTDGILERYEVTEERIAEEYARIAFSDIRGVVSWTNAGVTFRSSEDIPDWLAPAISEVGEKPLKGGGKAMYVKFHSKVAALDALAKWRKMFSDAPQLTNNNWLIEAPPQLSPEEWAKQYANRGGRTE